MSDKANITADQLDSELKKRFFVIITLVKSLSQTDFAMLLMLIANWDYSDIGKCLGMSNKDVNAKFLAIRDLAMGSVEDGQIKAGTECKS